jgi:ferredoxin
MPRVSNKQNGKVFEVKAGDILYDALDDQGSTLPHGCLSGSCGACRIEVHKGKENLDPIGFIEKNTVDSIKDYVKKSLMDPEINLREIRLSCRCKVMGDVEFSPYDKDKKK